MDSKELTQTINKLTKIRDIVNIVQKCKNADQIADLMQAERIKGEIGDENSCPISNFLQKELKVDVSVTESYINIYNKDGEDYGFSPSKSVKRFVSKFDNRKYPNLIR